MASLRHPSAYQDPRAPIRLIAQKGKRPLRNAMGEALSHLSDVFDKPKALHLLRNGMVAQIPREAVDWVHYREILKSVFDRWAVIFEAGAAYGTRKINGTFAQKKRKVRFGKAWDDGAALNDAVSILDGKSVITKDIGNRFNFDRFDDKTLAALKEVQDALLTDLTGQVRETILAVVMRAQNLGWSPAQIVDEIESVIGLTATQAVAVMNYETMLRGLNPNALGRSLRDDAFDGTLRDAIAIGIAPQEATIQEMVSAYEANYLQYRAEMIAQTESVRAANLGLHEAYRQAVDRGALPDEAVKRYWQTALDELVCVICRSIPDLNPEGASVSEDFFSDDGPQDNPPIHPNCRCSVEYVTDLDKVPDEAPSLQPQEIAA